MPPKRTAPQRSGARKVEEDTGRAQTESTTASDNYSSNDNNDYYNEEGVEDEGFGSDVTVGNTKSGRPRLKPMRHHAFEFDRQAGQPLVPNRPGMNNQPHGPSTKIPLSQPFASSQGHMPENPPSRYPSQSMNYPPGNPRQGDFSQYGSQPTNWSGMHTQQSMPGAWGSHAYSQYVGGSQAVPRSSDFYQSFPTQQSQPSRVDPKPATEEDSTPAQEEASTPAPKADSGKVKLEAELADLKGQKEKRERENEIRRELDGEMQQLRDQLEKTKQEAYKEVELARLQGERDALKRFDEIRREEQERQRQLAEQRMELESEIRVKLETERLAEIFQKETKERQFEELQKQAMESILEKLDDAVAISQAKLLQDNETEKEPDASEGKKPSQDLRMTMPHPVGENQGQILGQGRLTTKWSAPRLPPLHDLQGVHHRAVAKRNGQAFHPLSLTRRRRLATSKTNTTT
ncbi:hypothetical protein NW759_015153 [Fusarium solani]|nr:hypothetical protein NW759_015153 [Fusarium solani]